MAQSPAEPDRRPPRFPYVAALLCAACVGAAVWTWMRYSYAWQMSPSQLACFNMGDVGLSRFRTTHVGRYVSVEGCYNSHGKHGPPFLTESSRGDSVVSILGNTPGHETTPGRYRVTGRVRMDHRHLAGIDTDASLFHGASIAGLVVGAMGVFVFSVALRHWLRERRAAA